MYRVNLQYIAGSLASSTGKAVAMIRLLWAFFLPEQGTQGNLDVWSRPEDNVRRALTTQEYGYSSSSSHVCLVAQGLVRSSTTYRA